MAYTVMAHTSIANIAMACTFMATKKLWPEKMRVSPVLPWVMAYTGMPYVVMVRTVISCIVVFDIPMAYALTHYMVMAYMVMAYIVIAHTIMDYVLMACIFMACIVVAHMVKAHIVILCLLLMSTVIAINT